MTTNLTLASGQQAREQVLLYASQDPQFQTSTMPYNSFVANITSVNYRTEPLNQRVGGVRAGLAPDVGMGVDSCDVDAATCGDSPFHVRFDLRNPLAPLAFTTVPPETPVLEAVVNQTLVMRVLGGAGDQLQVHSVDGHWWALDPGMGSCALNHTACNSTLVAAVTLGPGESANAWIPKAGRGGQGDYLYATHRGPFLEDGAWGILRVCPPPTEQQGVTCLAGVVSQVVWTAVLNATYPFLRTLTEVIRFPDSCLSGNIVPCIQNLAGTFTVCPPLGLDNVDVIIPPLASLSVNNPIFSGFFPRCASINTNGQVHWTNDALPPPEAEVHTAGSKLDANAGAARCFASGELQPGDTFQMKFRYTPVPLPGKPKVESSANGGVTWKNCDAAADFTAIPGKAVIHYRCDIHSGSNLLIADMQGDIAIMPV